MDIIICFLFILSLFYMWRNKLFNSLLQLPIDRDMKHKAMYIVWQEGWENISNYIRKLLWEKIADYEKKKGSISESQLLHFREK